MYIEQTNSTSTLIREQYLDRENLFTVYTFFQTAGRGQMGNTWESEKGKNLLFSTLIQRPDITIRQQFALSMAIALAITDVLDHIFEQAQIDARPTIKWPNDIYVGDKKICGTLIEPIISGSDIVCAIAGIGINTNQTEWSDKVPNPISIKQIIGTDTDLHSLMTIVNNAISNRLQQLPHPDLLRSDFMQRLYRRTGWHLYCETQQDANNTPFEARIADITDIGQLILEKRDHTQHTYLLKQITFLTT